MEIPEIPNLILYAIPFFAITVIIEGLIIVKHAKENYSVKDTVSSISMGFGNVLIGLFLKVTILFILTYIWQHYRIATIPFTWWSWLLILFIEDFAYYWNHRIGHRSRLFWASHIVHHSSEKYNLSTALRQTWTGSFYTFIFWLWIAFIGFHPLMILTQMSISLIYQYWIHTELIHKMPRWFEAVFNTPSHHRVHHGSNPLYLDKNMAGIFIIWDKIFGTFQPEVKEEKVIYGLTANIDTFNPIKIAFNEWIAMLKDVFTSKTSISNKLKYLFKPPGWKHDGTGILSEDMLREWKEKNVPNV
ncbi:MAG: sterol desaturase/sphingolipid hydroxylase (fatty acid hydroxylase superfamily) [Flavobacteriales bacterium]|mgnify:CR=1 FL=1|jgi:sterol desaturase/sphingolipid hydroxylase (fatty acid hydroxylase superfamily)|tara:strand:- start:121 stop:1026 length:906 start_codon:yes stop_codon:yes gene_type:complete